MMLKTIKKLLAISLLPLLMLTHLSALADNKAEKSSPQAFTLDQAIDYALANNPDLQIAAERVGQDYQNSKAAELGIDAAEFERSTVRNALIQAVTATYYPKNRS